MDDDHQCQRVGRYSSCSSGMFLKFMPQRLANIEATAKMPALRGQPLVDLRFLDGHHREIDLDRGGDRVAQGVQRGVDARQMVVARRESRRGCRCTPPARGR